MTISTHQKKENVVTEYKHHWTTEEIERFIRTNMETKGIRIDPISLDACLIKTSSYIDNKGIVAKVKRYSKRGEANEMQSP